MNGYSSRWIKKSTGIEDNFVYFLYNITSNSLLDYVNEMTMNIQHLPPIPPAMQDDIQLLSLLNTSKAVFHCMKKLVKYWNLPSLPQKVKRCLQEKSSQVPYQPVYSEWSHAQKILHSTINQIRYRCSCPSLFGLHIFFANFTRIDEIF